MLMLLRATVRVSRKASSFRRADTHNRDRANAHDTGPLGLIFYGSNVPNICDQYYYSDKRDLCLSHQLYYLVLG